MENPEKNKKIRSQTAAQPGEHICSEYDIVSGCQSIFVQLHVMSSADPANSPAMTQCIHKAMPDHGTSTSKNNQNLIFVQWRNRDQVGSASYFDRCIINTNINQTGKFLL